MPDTQQCSPVFGGVVGQLVGVRGISVSRILSAEGGWQTCADRDRRAEATSVKLVHRNRLGSA